MHSGGPLTAPFFLIGWMVGEPTGWGQFGAHFARALHETGYEVYLAAPPDLSGVLPLDRPLLQSLTKPIPTDRDGWVFLALGNTLDAKPAGLPANLKTCALCVFEDSGALDEAAVERLRGYDQLIAPSRWVQSMLAAKGLHAPVCHQGYDARVFFPDPNSYGQWNEGIIDRIARQAPPSTLPAAIRAQWHSPARVFSGGKLEFRKGQDITIAAFRLFRETPEGKDAVLVTAWDNPWPHTMDGLWLSGYVKGVPTSRHGRADIVSWLEVNGIPREAVIDCGRLSPPELAQVMRSCTVGVFPSRAEGATNLVLVEALACGMPCIVSSGHGHDDLPAASETIGTLWLSGDSPPSGCRLYQSVAEWTDINPHAVARHLARGASRVALPAFSEYWEWRVRAPAFAEACLRPEAQEVATAGPFEELGANRPQD